jgi:ribosomal protein L4
MLLAEIEGIVKCIEFEAVGRRRPQGSPRNAGIVTVGLDWLSMRGVTQRA